MRYRDILWAYASGLCELILASLGFGVVALVALETLADAAGLSLDPSAALLLVWQALVLLALFPGQTFWTIRRTTALGYEHSIIGVPSDDDLRLSNHRAARLRRRRRD